MISQICFLTFKNVSSNLLLFSVYIPIQFPVTRFPPLSPPSVVSFFTFLSFFQMFFITHHSLDFYRSNTVQYTTFIVWTLQLLFRGYSRIFGEQSAAIVLHDSLLQIQTFSFFSHYIVLWMMYMHDIRNNECDLISSFHLYVHLNRFILSSRLFLPSPVVNRNFANRFMI